MTEFDEAWNAIVQYANGREEIFTLCRHIGNRIVRANGNEIVVISSRPISVLTERVLTKVNFQRAWNQLIRSGELYMNDLDPDLRGKRAIIMKLISVVPGISNSCDKRLRLIYGI